MLPAVRVDMFIRRARSAAAGVAVEQGDAASTIGDVAVAARFLLEYPKRGLRATARLQNGEFIVERGSTARGLWTGSPWHSYAQLHEELLRGGVIRRDGDHCVSLQSYAFASPSAAAAAIYGRTASGPSAWRVEGQGLSYRDWELRELARSAAP